MDNYEIDLLREELGIDTCEISDIELSNMVNDISVVVDIIFNLSGSKIQ